MTTKSLGVNKALNVTINALKKSRDIFQRENAEMMKQLARNKKGH